MSQNAQKDNPRAPYEMSSVFWSVAGDLLYLLPRRSGEQLVKSFSTYPDMRQNVEWFDQVLNYDANALLSWISAEGDEEDHKIYATVFLWKQRHKIIDASLRVMGDFEDSPRTYHLHRYMVANGDGRILDLPRLSSDGVDPKLLGLSYMAQVGQLLDRFSAKEIPEQSDDFERLVDLLPILGPRLDNYPRRSEVVGFVAHILNYSSEISGIPFLANDPGFTNISWLFLDLKLDPKQTWKTFETLALAKRKRSVSSYPALIAGLSMYPDRVNEILEAIEIQGGKELFLTLVSG